MSTLVCDNNVYFKSSINTVKSAWFCLDGANNEYDKILVKSCSSSFHCPAPNPKPLVFPHAALKRFAVQMDCDPAETRPERTSEQT